MSLLSKFRALAEIHRSLLRATEPQVGQPAEVEDARILRAALDRNRQTLVRPLQSPVKYA